MTDQTPQSKHFVLLILLAFVWGSSFILMKLGLFNSDGSPLFSSWQVGAMRISFAGLVLLPVALRKAKEIKKEQWKWLFAVGAIGNTIPAFLFTAAQTKIASSVAGMLNSLTPLFALVVALLFFGSRFTTRQVTGVIIGFLGAIGLISLGSDGEEVHIPYALMIVVATICYAFSVNIIRNKLLDVPSVTIAATSLAMMGTLTGIWLLFSGVEEVVQTEGGPKGVLAIAVLGAVGTAGALAIFNRVIQETSVIFSSSVTYIIPIFAALWGWVDGETLQWGHLIFAAIILFGVYLGRAKKPA